MRSRLVLKLSYPAGVCSKAPSLTRPSFLPRWFHASSFRTRCIVLHCGLLAGRLNAADSDPPSFLNDVIPVLTKTGCNQGECHGKGAGQNGFRLSLRGYAPDQDWRSIAREFDGRRIDPAHPEESLLLRKPVGLAPHEGGRMFDTSSRDYGVLMNWIQAGAPRPRPDDARLKRLEILPAVRNLKAGEEVQLQAFGEFSDGSRRDVTWLTRFESNDPGMLRVDYRGKVTSLRNGESAIRASFQTEVAVGIFTMPYERTVDRAEYKPRNNFIDNAVYAKLAVLNIEPAELCTDEEFIRRVFLDTIGTLPTSEEVRTFLADRSAAKECEADRCFAAAARVRRLLDPATRATCCRTGRSATTTCAGRRACGHFHKWLRKQVAG